MCIANRHATRRGAGSRAGMTAMKEGMCQINGARKELKGGASTSA